MAGTSPAMTKRRSFRGSKTRCSRRRRSQNNRRYDEALLIRSRPSDLPDGLFGSPAVQPHLQKYFRSGLTQIRSITPAVSSQGGAIARRHERGAGCGGRESVRRATAIAGRDEPRERSASVRDDRRFSGRQSRVVLTPVAGAKLAEAKSSPTGLDEPLIRQ